MATKITTTKHAGDTKTLVLALLKEKKTRPMDLVNMLGLNWRTAERILRGDSELSLDDTEQLLAGMGLRIILVRKECLQG